MSKYKTVEVNIILDTEDPLYARLEAEAQRHGTTVDMIVDALISAGSYWLLDERLKLWEARK